MEIASSATSTWQDLDLLSARHVQIGGYIWEGVGFGSEKERASWEVMESMVGVIVVDSRSFLSSFFEKLVNYHGVGFESF